MNNMQQKITQLLAPLNLQYFEFEDQSAAHVHHTHKKQGGHFALLLVSESFAHMNRLARHRRVQELLNPLCQNQEIHALSIVAKTPNEYFQ